MLPQETWAEQKTGRDCTPQEVYYSSVLEKKILKKKKYIFHKWEYIKVCILKRGQNKIKLTVHIHPVPSSSA